MVLILTTVQNFALICSAYCENILIFMRLVEKTEDQRYFNNIFNQQVKILVFHELTIFYKFRIFELEHNRKTFYLGIIHNSNSVTRDNNHH